jgi:hypothetical protein
MEYKDNFENVYKQIDKNLAAPTENKKINEAPQEKAYKDWDNVDESVSKGKK